MEKEQIIKALECCSSGHTSTACKECPLRYEEGTCDDDSNYVMIQALSLIREQDKRIEEIKDATVRKMADRLKEKIIDVDTDDATLWMECVNVEDIDQIAKEILEET